MKKLGYKHTVVSCFLGFMCQAIIVNFAPLLFLTFSSEFSIPMSDITLLVTSNFAIQFLTDLTSPRFIDKIGYKKAMILAHALCSLGLILLPILPMLLGGFPGLLIATFIYAVGGGLLEVLVGPIIESCPTENKSGAMSLMHSFYCWGVVMTVLISTAYFTLFGVENWKILSLVWAVLPLLNLIFITQVPMPPITPVEKGKTDLKTVFSSGIFWVFLLMMVASGASEMAIQQWASTFAETALGVSKTLGDLLGVCGFSLMMATARTIYGNLSHKLPPRASLAVCAVMSIACYLAISLINNSVIGFAACIICGFSVGIFWPATFSLATSHLIGCTTAMFALLSLAGDIGCTLGPTVTGFVSDAFDGNFRAGILVATVFPVLLMTGVVMLIINKTRKKF